MLHILFIERKNLCVCNIYELIIQAFTTISGYDFVWNYIHRQVLVQTFREEKSGLFLKNLFIK